MAKTCAAGASVGDSRANSGALGITRHLAGLVAAVHFAAGSEVGAFVLEVLSSRLGLLLRLDDVVTDAAFEEARKKEGEGGDRGLLLRLSDAETAEASKLLLVVSYLYVFGVVGAGFCFALLAALLRRFSQRDLELALLVLRHVGFNLRSDDPSALRDLVLVVQRQAADRRAAAEGRGRGDGDGSNGGEGKGKREGEGEGEGDGESEQRVSWMVECIIDLKNNRRRRAFAIEAERSEGLLKWMARVRQVRRQSNGMESNDKERGEERRGEREREREREREGGLVAS